MILALLLLLQSPFQAALDAAPPGATLNAADYAPIVKTDIIVLKPVTILNGVFASSHDTCGDAMPGGCGRSILPAEGDLDERYPALRIFDQDAATTDDLVVFVDSIIVGDALIRFDQLMLLRCRVEGTLRAFPITTMTVTDSFVRADQHRVWSVRPPTPPYGPAAIAAPECSVILDASLVKGGSGAVTASGPCMPLAGGAGVRSAPPIIIINNARMRGGRGLVWGACVGPQGPGWISDP